MSGYDVGVERLPLQTLFDLKGPRRALADWCEDLPSFPRLANTAVSRDGVMLCWVGPERWLLRAELGRESGLLEALRPEEAPPGISVVCVSDTLAFFRVTGADAVVVQAPRTHSSGRQVVGDCGLVDVLGQLDRQVQSGRDSPDGDAGHVGQHVDQDVASLPIRRAGSADVAVVAAGRQQDGECPLVDGRRMGIGDLLELLDRRYQRGRNGDPAQPERGRERLADRSAEDHVFGRQAVHGADG